MNWALYGAAGYMTASALAVIALVGRPRPPIKPGVAVFSVTFAAAIAVLLVLAGMRMT